MITKPFNKDLKEKAYKDSLLYGKQTVIDNTTYYCYVPLKGPQDEGK